MLSFPYSVDVTFIFKFEVVTLFCFVLKLREPMKNLKFFEELFP